MKRILSVVVLLVAVFVLAACGQEEVKCGAGTEYVDGQCVAPDNEDPTCEDDQTLVDGVCEDNEEPTECNAGYSLIDGVCIQDEIQCQDDEELVDGECQPIVDPLECDEGYEEVDGECQPIEVVIDPTGLESVANVDFTDSITGWATEGSVTLSHDAAGYLVANVSAFSGAFYQENVQLGDMVTEKDFTYTVTFVVKTDVEAGRNVMFFLEDTDNAYAKFFEETVTLTTEFQSFTYTYVATTNNSDTKIGLFLGDMENAALGNVIIDSITVVKEAGLQGNKFEDLANADFTDSDISAWGTEGNVALSHNAEGYLVIDVTGLTGNFWEENITYRDLIVETWVKYTVEVVIRGDVSRDVILFAEDTDNAYAKYADVTHTVTTEWTTITLQFTPTETNADTTLGLFFGTMENSELGQFEIDSITIIAEPTFN